MKFESTIYPAQKISPEASPADLAETAAVDLDTELETAESAEELETAEATQHFVLDSHEGLTAFATFLQSEGSQIDALDPDLDIAGLDLPGNTMVSLQRLRLEYRDLVRLTNQALQSEAVAIPEELADSIATQYQAYIRADEKFATAYIEQTSTQPPADEIVQVPVESVSQEVLSADESSEQSKTEASAERRDNETISELKQEIETAYAAIKNHHDTAKGQFPFATWPAAVQEVFDELNSQREAALKVVKKLNEAYQDNYAADSEVAAKLQAYVRIIDKIKNQVEQYMADDATQEILFTDTEPAHEESSEAPAPDTADESQAAEAPLVLEPEQRIDVQPAVRKEWNTEILVDYSAAENRIAELQQLLEESTVLSEPERQDIQTGIEQLQSKVERGVSKQELEQALVAVETLTLSESEGLPVATMVERSKKMQETARSIADDQDKQTAIALAEKVDQLVVGQWNAEGVTAAEIRQAYQALEDFMQSLEQVEIKVCGLAIPVAGPEGVRGARLFRSNLESARSEHPDLKDAPAKRAIVDRIINVLFVVPQSGLTAEQIQRVEQLAGELDAVGTVPEEQSEAFAIPIKQEVVAESDTASGKEDAAKEDLAIDKEDDFDEWSPHTSKRLGIAEDPEEGGNIEITVDTAAATDEESGSVGTTKQDEQEAAPARDIQPAINHSLPTAEKRRAAASNESQDNQTLVAKYLLKNPEYKKFFQESGVSPGAFERILQTEIKRVDAKEIDFWEANFDDPYKSAFAHLQELSLEDIEGLNNLSPTERRKALAQQDVKYEAYLAWMDIYDAMSQASTLNPQIKFAELFAQWMLETEMTYYEGGTEASQFTL